MSSGVQKIGYPCMDSKIYETGLCHVQAWDHLPDYGANCDWIENKIGELHTD